MITDPTSIPYQRDIITELGLAKQNKLPLFIIFAKSLKAEEKIELERHFMHCNIFKTAEADIDTSKSEAEIERQVQGILDEALNKEGIEIVRDAYQFQRSLAPDDLFVIVANKSYLRRLRIGLAGNSKRM